MGAGPAGRPAVALYEFAPELIILLLDPAALFPKTAACGRRRRRRLAGRARGRGWPRSGELLAAAQRHAPAATLLLHTFALPDYAPLGILDSEDGGRAARPL